jgi:hypothetical protein
MRTLLLLLVAVALAGSNCAAAEPRTAILAADFVIDDGHGLTTIQDPNASVSFQLPAGWVLTGGVRWGNHETTLSILDTASRTVANVYYQYPIQSTIRANLDAALISGRKPR